MHETSNQHVDFIKHIYSFYHLTRTLIFENIKQNLNFDIEDNRNLKEEYVNISQNVMNRFLFLLYFYFDSEHRNLLQMIQSSKLSKGSYNIWKKMCTIFQEYKQILEDKGLFDLDLLKENIIIFDLRTPETQKENASQSQIEFLNDSGQSIALIKEDINPIYKNLLIISKAIETHRINFELLMRILEIAILDLGDIANIDSVHKSHGVYYTPQFIADYMVEAVLFRSLSIYPKIPSSIDELIAQYADTIDELINKIQQLRILDPSCGSGIFLIAALRYLQNLYQNIFEYCRKKGIKSNGLTKIQNPFDIITNIAENNIYGVDIMPNAVEIAKLQIYILLKNEKAKIPNLSKNIKCGNSLLESEFNWKQNFKEIFTGAKSPGFTIVIGNPPWGGSLNTLPKKASQYSKKFTTAVHQFDSFSLFIEHSFRSLLANTGYFSFIIPNDLCTNRSFADVRRLLLTEASIFEIINMGEHIFESVNRPCMIFILQKKAIKKEELDVALIEIRRGYSFEDKVKLRSGEYSLRSLLPNNNNSIEIYKRTQSSFLNNKHYLWDIFRTEQDKKIIDKIQNNPNILKFGYVMKNGRGFDINKEGKYILCKNCKTGNPFFGKGNSIKQTESGEKTCINCGIALKRELIEGMPEKDPDKPSVGILKTAFSKTPEEGMIPIAVGEDITCMNLKVPTRYINPNNPDLKMFDLKLKQAEHLYKGERIFIRKVGNPLVATIVREEIMCNDQCYVWKLKKAFEKYSYHYCLAILLCDFQYFYYSLQTGNLEKDAFPHFRQDDIKQFPFPLIDFDSEQKKIHDTITEKMIALETIIKRNPNEKIKETTELREEINRLVYRIFEINPSEIENIEKITKKKQ